MSPAEVENMLPVPASVRPICGTQTQPICEDGKKNSTVFNRVIAYTQIDFYSSNDCSGSSILHVNNTYLVRYRKKSFDSGSPYAMYLIRSVVSPKSQDGVTKFNEMKSKYCPSSSIEATVDTDIDVMPNCRRMTIKVFKNHLFGKYTYGSDNSTLSVTESLKSEAKAISYTVKGIYCYIILLY